MLKFRQKTIIFLVVVIGLVLADFLFFNSFIGGRVYDGARRPLNFVMQKSVSIAGFTRVFVNTARIERENESLRQENQKLIADVSNLKGLEKENAILRTRLGISAPEHRQLVFATVFSFRGAIQLGGFMIDKGGADGIEEGMAVISSENILAGVVSKIYEHSAVVLLPQSSNLSINVAVQGRKVLARSRGDGTNAILDFVTSQDEVQKDDIIVTAGFDKIPAAIPVFKVYESNQNGGELFKQVKVSPIISLLDISRVFVVR